MDVPVEAGNEETESASWIGQKLHDLSLATRAEPVHFIEGMSNNAPWDARWTRHRAIFKELNDQENVLLQFPVSFGSASE